MPIKYTPYVPTESAPVYVPHPYPNQTYFVVMATGLVQGVFGSALQDQAIACAKRIPFGGCVFRASFNGRPVVGKSCTPQTDWEEIPII